MPSHTALSRAEIAEIYHQPFPHLLYHAMKVHRTHHNACAVQLSRLLSIKTGGCREDCAYCPQSAHYPTAVNAERLWDVDSISAAAQKAKQSGAQRFCMGAAWSSPPRQGAAYESLLAAARKVKDQGLEVCMTLGMLTKKQAQDLAEAGVDYYNHNLDTSPEYYRKIITTRNYEDRINTLKHVRSARMKVCCGGIIGMGESLEDRMGLLEQLSRLDPHPESVPINRFVKVAGTPLGADDSFSPLDMVRMIATTRIVLPRSVIRLSAGRSSLSAEAQTLCFLAGAGSIFTGERLLTTSNTKPDEDQMLMEHLGLQPTPTAAP